MLNTAVIVIGGDEIPVEALEELPDRAWVIAADSGLHQATRIGLEVDFVIGDMDSIDEDRLADHRGLVDRHPADKDSTDFELALDLAIERPNIERIIVLGGRGGRLDHFLANASVIAADRFATCEIEWIAGLARVVVVRHHAQLHGVPGQTVSLLPAGGAVTGVTTTGLEWQLAEDTILFGSTRGVSNLFSKSVATVRVRSGCLLAVVPEPFE